MRMRKHVDSGITIGDLKKMLSEWPDDSPIDIFLTSATEEEDYEWLADPAVCAEIRSVDLVVEQEKGKPPFVMIYGRITSLDLDFNLER